MTTPISRRRRRTPVPNLLVSFITFGSSAGLTFTHRLCLRLPNLLTTRLAVSVSLVMRKSEHLVIGHPLRLLRHSWLVCSKCASLIGDIQAAIRRCHFAVSSRPDPTDFLKCSPQVHNSHMSAPVKLIAMHQERPPPAGRSACTPLLMGSMFLQELLRLVGSREGGALNPWKQARGEPEFLLPFEMNPSSHLLSVHCAG
jgi:hypothetical protein